MVWNLLIPLFTEVTKKALKKVCTETRLKLCRISFEDYIKWLIYFGFRKGATIYKSCVTKFRGNSKLTCVCNYWISHHMRHPM